MHWCGSNRMVRGVHVAGNRFTCQSFDAITTREMGPLGPPFLDRGTSPTVRGTVAMHACPVGSVLVFSYPGDHDRCVLVRLSDAEFVAYNQKCTHLSCAVIPQPERGVLHCPCHEGYFDLRSGRPTAGPPSRPLARIALEIRGRDVYATGVEWRTS